MTEVEGGDDLSEEPSGFFGRESALLDEIVEEFAAGNVLQDQIEILFVLVHVVKTQDVRVLDQLHYGYLPLHLG